MATGKRKRVVLSIKDKLQVCCLSKKKVSWRLLLTIEAAVLVKHVHWLTPNTDLGQPLTKFSYPEYSLILTPSGPIVSDN